MKIDRLIGIITCLLQCDKVTAPELAKKFEVSRRTILRDIDVLAQAGIPVFATQGGGGGISIIAGYKLDKSVLTADELESIITGLKSLDSISRDSNTERLIRKLSPDRNSMVSLNDHIIIDLSSHYKDSLSEKIKLIKQAILEKKLIEFDYYYSKGNIRRRIEPYFIQFKWTSWYVYGWCPIRLDFRLFKLNRLWELVLTDECISPHDIPPDAAAHEMNNPEPYNVLLLFDKSMRFRVIESYGLNCYTETDDGLVFDLDYTNREYIMSWVLGFGDKVTVIKPDDFRDEIAQTAENIITKYKRT